MYQQTLVGSVSKAFNRAAVEPGQAAQLCVYLGYVVPLPWHTKRVFGYGCAVFVLVTGNEIQRRVEEI